MPPPSRPPKIGDTVEHPVRGTGIIRLTRTDPGRAGEPQVLVEITTDETWWLDTSSVAANG